MDRPYWNDHPHQSFDCNLGWYARLFNDDEDKMAEVLGGHEATKRQYYTTKEVYGILCRWYNKPITTDAWSGYEDSLGVAFAWVYLSGELDKAFSYSGDHFDPYKEQPYTSYDIFRILYRLKYGEWLPAMLVNLSDIRPKSHPLAPKKFVIRAPIIEHRGSEAGACRDGKEPLPPSCLKVPKKVHDGTALFAGLDRMGRK